MISLAWKLKKKRHRYTSKKKGHEGRDRNKMVPKGQGWERAKNRLGKVFPGEIKIYF